MATTTNSNAAAKRYKKVDPREHVLLRPGMYIGSTEPDRLRTWTLDPDSGRFVKRDVDYVPGLYKIFDEILVNSIDHGTRLKTIKNPPAQFQVKSIKISIDAATGFISVENDGDGIPVVIHPESGVYVPEMIFGQLMTSSNYDDAEERVIGGQNGIGAKACNIFSKRFTVETVDSHTLKKYVQTFRDNMSVRDPPKITTVAATKKPYTKITFLPDYKRFHCDGLSVDMHQLFLRRCYDVCALTDVGVSVTVDSKKLAIKSFEKYVDLYMGEEGANRKRAYEVIDTKIGQWEVIATYNDSGAFEQVSFVNGVFTIKGGRHVDHVASMIAAKIGEIVAKKKKGLEPKPAVIKSHLFLFLRATISNPEFDGQSKETLTSPVGKFGTGKIELSDKFYDKLSKTGIVDRVIELSEASQMKDLKKTDGKLRTRVTGIAKLDDANWAGGPKRAQCTLILTEGDSAKTMAISGMSIVGRDRYGVFPLRGKLLNVKDVALKKLMENEEITHIKTIMGLESGKKYSSSDDLRYGRIMIMTDQDVDGSHIKGLIFNLFETLWPTLLRVPGFLVSMLTPIIKVSKGKLDPVSFFSMQDYDVWKAKPTSKGYTIKYYKGLGTSTAAEAKDYFREMRLVSYACDDPLCKEKLDIAFNKKRADDRKVWLGGYKKNDVIEYGVETRVPFSTFVDKDLIHFSIYDGQRSIPSVIDGLKPSQRKILFTCFTRNYTKEIKVFMLTANVAETAAYHHGDASLSEAIVSMAQDFVGSNNINLLEPNGQFGTRRMGGSDAASARYISTKACAITDKIFRPEDRPVLTYLEDDGISVEPEFYVPIIPMVLINSISGIGTGFSVNVPAFNPLEITRILLGGDDSKFDSMKPWYRGFTGVVEPSRKRGADDDDLSRFVTRGIYERTGPKTIRVTELPVFFWTEKFKELLEARIASNELQSYDSNCTEDKVDFTLTFSSKDALDELGDKFVDEFKIAFSDNKLSLNNMHLYNENLQIKKYPSARAIAREFIRVRTACYSKRKAYILTKLREENEMLSMRGRFIEEVIADTLKIRGVPMDKVVSDMTAKKYAKVDDSFEYLLRMSISSLTKERKMKLDAEIKENEGKIRYYEETSEKEIWFKELKELEAVLVAERVYGV